MGTPKFYARSITKENLTQWNKLVENWGYIFYVSDWLDIYGAEVKKVGIFDRNDNLVGGFVYRELKIGVIKTFLAPIYIPYIGPFYYKKAENKVAQINEQREILKTVNEYLKSQSPAIVSLPLSPYITDTLPFFWSKYKVTVYYTYILDLTQSMDVIISNMTSEKRNRYKKALKDGIKVECSDDIDALIYMLEKSYKRQKIDFPRNIIENIIAKFPPGKYSKLFIAKRRNEPVYGAYMVYDKRCAFNLMPAYDHDKPHTGAGVVTIIEAIKTFKDMGIECFDFEGSMVPSIERFFRGFGGKLTPYFRVSIAPLALEIPLKFIKREIF